MQFRARDGIYEAQLVCGDVVTFEDRCEWEAGQREYCEIMALLGKREKCEVRSSECGAEISRSPVSRESKKRVRFRVHTGVFRAEGRRLVKMQNAKCKMQNYEEKKKALA